MVTRYLPQPHTSSLPPQGALLSWILRLTWWVASGLATLRGMSLLKSRLIELRQGNTRALLYPEQGFQLYGFDVKLKDDRTVSAIYAGDGPTEPWDRRHGNPILFPNICDSYVGDRQGVWQWDGKELLMPQHGWARDLYYYIEERDDTSLTAKLAKPHSLAIAYPFDFDLRLRYRVEERSLILETEVQSRDERPFPYALGFHPYLRAPLTNDSSRSHCEVALPSAVRVTSPDTWKTLHEHEIEEQTLKANDPTLGEGIVLERSHTDSLSIQDHASGLQTTVSVADSPDPLPVWAAWCEAPDSDYVCLEPWTSGPNPLAKDAVILQPGGTHRYRMTITLSDN